MSCPFPVHFAYLTVSLSPANAEAAGLYRDNMKEYIRRVKLTVEESWLDAPEDTVMTDKSSSAAPTEVPALEQQGQEAVPSG